MMVYCNLKLMQFGEINITYIILVFRSGEYIALDRCYASLFVSSAIKTINIARVLETWRGSGALGID